MKQRIYERLESALTPDRLEVVDESEKHRGHAGYRDGGESHFHVSIVASAFNDMSRVERQRCVMSLLREEMKTQIHALSIDAQPSTIPNKSKIIP